MTGYTAIVVFFAMPGSLEVGLSSLQDYLVPSADISQVKVFARSAGSIAA